MSDARGIRSLIENRWAFVPVVMMLGTVASAVVVVTPARCIIWFLWYSTVRCEMPSTSPAARAESPWDRSRSTSFCRDVSPPGTGVPAAGSPAMARASASGP